MMITYFKYNLSILLQPYTGTDPDTGRSKYGKQGIMTTVNYEGAAALFLVASDILDGKTAAQEIRLTIPCVADATITLERVQGQDGQMETFLTVAKNNESLAFKFTTHQIKIKQNNQDVVNVVEAGLGAFVMTIKGYLTGINSSGHLNEFGENLEAIHEECQREKETWLYNASENNQGVQLQMGNYSGYPEPYN